VRKNPLLQFVAWALLLSRPAFAQEAIQIEIDSAPVEVEIQKPAEPEPAKQPEPSPPLQAESPEPAADEGQEEEKGGKNYAVAIGIGALVAGLLAALGGGGSGGGSSTPQH